MKVTLARSLVVSSSLALAAALYSAPATTGCAAFKAEAPVLEQDAEQLGEQAIVCVVAQVAMGNVSAPAIGIACGIPLASTVITLATKAAAQLEAYTAPTDAGAVGAAIAGVDLKTLSARLRSVK